MIQYIHNDKKVEIMSIMIILADNNESDELFALRRFESLYLYNELMNYEKKDKNSPNYEGQSIQNLLDILEGRSKKSEEILDFESSLISKYLGLESTTKRKEIDDVYYRDLNNEKVRKSDFEIDYSLNLLKAVVEKYDSKALSQDAQSINLQDLSSAKEDLNKIGLMKNDVVDYEKLNKTFGNAYHEELLALKSETLMLEKKEEKQKENKILNLYNKFK